MKQVFNVAIAKRNAVAAGCRLRARAAAFLAWSLALFTAIAAVAQTTPVTPPALGTAG